MAAPALFGRDREVARLSDALADAEKARGALVLLSGEAGIGKSALALVSASLAEASGANVVWGRAWELAEAPPYFPLWPCLRSLDLEPPSRETAGDDAFRLWERVLAGLAETSRDRTIVWIVEDVHAADVQTLDLLTFLAVPVRALRVVVLVTLRPSEPQVGERENRRLLRMARDGVEIRLEPLESESVTALAERLVGRRVGAAAAAALLHRTGGNPLFVVECANVLAGTRTDAAAFTLLPPQIGRLVTDRVARLPPATRAALDAGAVLGRSFSAHVVSRMLGTTTAETIDALLAALRARILSELAPGEFSFSHILVRDAIEAELAAFARMDLHARAADALRASVALGIDVRVERARHALASGQSVPAAIAFAEDVARELQEDGAVDRAYAMLLRIDEARVGTAGHVAVPEERLRLAGAAASAGRFADTRRICEEVIAHARATENGELLGRAALVVGGVLQPGAVDRTLTGLLAEALVALDKGETALRCRVEARLAAALQPAPDPRGPMEMARAAIARARATGDAALLTDVLFVAGSALVEFGGDVEQIELAEELGRLAVARGDLPKAVRAGVRLALQQLRLGDVSGWNATCARALELARELGHPRHCWPALLLASAQAIARGDFGASESHVVEVQQLASVTDDPALERSLRAHLMARARLLHRDDELRSSIPEIAHSMIGVPDRDVLAGVIRASGFTRLEDAELARAELGRIRGRFRQVEDGGAFGALLAEIYAFVGTDEERRRCLSIFEPRAERQITGGHVPLTYEGPVLRLLALLHASLGDHRLAVAELDRALEGATAHGHLAIVAQLEYDRARVLAGSGRAEESCAGLRQAATLAHELGMPGLADRARARLAAAPSQDPSAVASTPRVDVPPRQRVPFTMSREGDAWRVSHDGHTVVVRHTRGMQLLARLVARSDEELHVLALAAEEGTELVDRSAGSIIDSSALRAYRERLRELDVALDEADGHGDLGRLEKLRNEREALESEVRRAVGLGGRVRGETSVSERARVNVQRRLKDALARIGEAAPDIARYLEKAVRTGMYCSFRP